jgi:hypothetical protein
MVCLIGTTGEIAKECVRITKSVIIAQSVASMPTDHRPKVAPVSRAFRVLVMVDSDRMSVMDLFVNRIVHGNVPLCQTQQTRQQPNGQGGFVAFCLRWGLKWMRVEALVYTTLLDRILTR